MEYEQNNLPSYTSKYGQKGHSSTPLQRGLKGPRKRFVFQPDFIPVIFDDGQSNAIGRAESERLEKLTKYPFDPSNIWAFYKPDRTSTDNGLWFRMQVGSAMTVEPGTSVTHFGGYYTAAVQLSVILNRDVFIIPVGEGATTITPNSTFRDHYPETVNECFRVATSNYFKPAIDKLRATYPGREIVVFKFFHEGETDAFLGTRSNMFYSAFLTYHNALNSFDPLFKRSPWIITKLYYLISSDEDRVNEQVYEKFVSENPDDAFLVDISAYPRKVDLTPTESGG